MFAPWLKRKLETAPTIPGRSGQEMRRRAFLYTEAPPDSASNAKLSPEVPTSAAELYTVCAWTVTRTAQARRGGSDDRIGRPSPRLHALRPGWRAGHPLLASRALGGPLLLPEGRHPGLHHAGLRCARPLS